MRHTLSVVALHLKSNFVVYGSFPAAQMVKAMKHVGQSFPVEDKDAFMLLHDMQYDDIDIAHGDFHNGTHPEFNMKTTKKVNLGLDKEVNFVHAANIPMGEDFLQTIDVNVVGVCCEVQVNGDGKVQSSKAFIHPAFFVFAIACPTVEEPIRLNTPAQTCVRIAYKAMKLGLKFDFGGLDPCKGVLFNSHRVKVSLGVVINVHLIE